MCIFKTGRSNKKEELIKYKIPKSNEVKLIDFGGATYDHEYHSEIINTR